MRMSAMERETLGEEPIFTNGGSHTEILRAYNWYAYFYTVSDARDWIIDYMKSKNYINEDIIEFKKIKDDQIGLTICSSARMIMRGAQLDYDVDCQIKYLLSKHRGEVHEVFKSTWKPNPIIELIDSALDIFYQSGYSNGPNLSEALKNSLKYYLTEARSHCEGILAELQSTDPQVVEAYDHLSRKQKKSYIQYLEQICGWIGDAKTESKRQIKRKPRKKKEKPVEQLVKKVKYQLSDKDLDVTSLPPEKLIGATQAWLFNTKTRKLAKYVGAENKTLTIKGTTILNYDEKLSTQKTIRKPKDFVRLVETEAKVPLNKAFDKIKAVPQEVSGRINGFTLILRTIK